LRRKKLKPPSDARDRKDHYAPQGHLRGFIHPQREGHPKPLWVLDIERMEWSEKSSSQIGWERGFYDYSPGSNIDATADDAFRRLENQLPRLRDRIRTDGYESWGQHRAVLVSFAAMMAARSRLFRTQTVSQILPLLAADANRDVLAKNFSITQMRTEIERRPKDWEQFHWVLGYTKNPEHPFIASDQGIGMWGNAADITEAYVQNDFWLWCPLSWDMCMIASSQSLSGEPTAELRPEHVTEIQILTRRQAMIFIASRVPLPNICDPGGAANAATRTTPSRRRTRLFSRVAIATQR
jgi:hypothetical protein